MDSINRLWDQVGKAWEYGLTALKVAAYIVLFAICVSYDGVHFFVKGYFLSDLTIHVIQVIRTYREVTIRAFIELFLYLGVACWMCLEGTMFPARDSYAGMMAVGFISFFLLKWVLMDWRLNRRRPLLREDR